MLPASLIPSHLQAFLTKLLTVDLPALITLPKRLEINIPPAVTAGALLVCSACCARCCLLSMLLTVVLGTSQL